MRPDHAVTEPLWAKDLPLDAAIHRFTVGEDPETDLALLAWDALGSAAHARMLAATGLIPEADAVSLVRGLRRIANLAKQGAFPIPPHMEDGHTAIEADLTRSLGDPWAAASTWAAPATTR